MRLPRKNPCEFYNPQDPAFEKVIENCPHVYTRDHDNCGGVILVACKIFGKRDKFCPLKYEEFKKDDSAKGMAEALKQAKEYNHLRLTQKGKNA